MIIFLKNFSRRRVALWLYISPIARLNLILFVSYILATYALPLGWDCKGRKAF